MFTNPLPSQSPVLHVTRSHSSSRSSPSGTSVHVPSEPDTSQARHVPAELPRLSGPDERSADVAARYLDVRDQLIPLVLDLLRVQLDARGSWQMTLNNGIDVRLGRRDVAERTDLYLDVVADIITGRAADIEYVDMRYSNGFTIGWNNGSRTPVDDAEEGVNATARQEHVPGVVVEGPLFGGAQEIAY